MKKGFIFSVVLGALAVGYVAATPYIVLYRVKTAIANRDGSELAEYIDFESVRQSVKEQFNAAVLAEVAVAGSNEEQGFAALGAALGGVMVDRMVDAMVTPAGLNKLMDGASKRGMIGEPLQRASTSYSSLGRFTVTTADDAAEQATFVLRRQGLLGWKITEVVLPKSIFEKNDEAAPNIAATVTDGAALSDGGNSGEPQAAVEAADPNMPTHSYAPLLQPNGVITQGRCHMGSCSWAKWVSVNTVFSGNGEILLTTSVIGGSSEHAEVEDYPSAPAGVTIAWDQAPHSVQVRCSYTKPAVWSGDDNPEVISLNTDSGVFGYQESDAMFYFTACHSDSSVQGLRASIAKYGYEVRTDES